MKFTLKKSTGNNEKGRDILLDFFYVSIHKSGIFNVVKTR